MHFAQIFFGWILIFYKNIFNDEKVRLGRGNNVCEYENPKLFLPSVTTKNSMIIWKCCSKVDFHVTFWSFFGASASFRRRKRLGLDFKVTSAAFPLCTIPFRHCLASSQLGRRLLAFPGLQIASISRAGFGFCSTKRASSVLLLGCRMDQTALGLHLDEKKEVSAENSGSPQVKYYLWGKILSYVHG